MFRENADSSISWFNLDETYRWGQGFIEGDMECNLPYEGDTIVYAKPDCGWGCEFDDSISIELEFSDDISEDEQTAIRESYREGGAAWMYDGDHAWQEEDSAVHIFGPFQVSLCNDGGIVIEEHVKLKARPNPATSWPFSEAFPKEE
jgi:hypothetical protein